MQMAGIAVAENNHAYALWCGFDPHQFPSFLTTNYLTHYTLSFHSKERK